LKGQKAGSPQPFIGCGLPPFRVAAWRLLFDDDLKEDAHVGFSGVRIKIFGGGFINGRLGRAIADRGKAPRRSPRTLKTDVRIIAATNRNLTEEVKSHKFREDLYYRLNVFPITLPPLRQRQDDIPLLVQHFIAKFNAKIGRKIESVPKETMSALQEYHWPGNVRELESVIERAVIISQGRTLQVLDRFDTFRKVEEAGGQEIKALVELEHDHILLVLQKTGWRIEGKNGAAGLLGLNASTLRARMRKYGIVRQ